MLKIVVNNSRIELYNVDRLNRKKKALQASSTHININGILTVDMRTTMAAIVGDMVMRMRTGIAILPLAIISSQLFIHLSISTLFFAFVDTFCF